MAKGKYAARAANRLVQTDNDLLREKAAQCERLACERDRLQHEINRLRKQMHSEAMHHGAELAADDMRRVQGERDSLAAEFEQYRERAAIDCWNLYQEFGASLGENTEWDIYFEKYCAIFGLNSRQQAVLFAISHSAYQGSRFRARAAQRVKKMRSIGDALEGNPGLRVHERRKDDDL